MASRIEDATKNELILIVTPNDDGTVNILRGVLPPGGSKVEKPFIAGNLKPDESEMIMKLLTDQRSEFGAYHPSTSLVLDERLPEQLRRELVERNQILKTPFKLRKKLD